MLARTHAGCSKKFHFQCHSHRRARRGDPLHGDNNASKTKKQRHLHRSQQQRQTCTMGELGAEGALHITKISTVLTTSNHQTFTRPAAEALRLQRCEGAVRLIEEPVRDGKTTLERAPQGDGHLQTHKSRDTRKRGPQPRT